MTDANALYHNDVTFSSSSQLHRAAHREIYDAVTHGRRPAANLIPLPAAYRQN